MKKLLLTFSTLFILLSPAFAQNSIDGDFIWESDPEKGYSLYIPSDYVDGTAHRAMLALHPWNTSRWDAFSWRDTLIDFAEANSLILICPDGGPDGQIDDPIDTSFTTALLDSVESWYDIDTAKVYVMGFSWGGRTTYTYGLLRPQRLKGFIPIGAAIEGTSTVTPDLQNAANGRPVYIVHGSLDDPNTRFYPVRDALDAAGAILKDTLMSGVGHTIDFPNRNAILGRAFQWVDSVNCALIDDQGTGLEHNHFQNLKVYPTLLPAGSNIYLEATHFNDLIDVSVIRLDGTRMAQHLSWQLMDAGRIQVESGNLSAGMYLLTLSGFQGTQSVRVLIQ
jgi:predicted esterase